MSLQPILAYFRQSWAVFLQIYLAFALFSIANYGTVNWGVPVLTRQFAMAPGAAVHSLGTIFFFTGAIGALATGQILDTPAISPNPGTKLLLMALLPLFILPAAAMTFAPTAQIAIVALSSLILFSPMLSITMLHSLSIALMSFAGTLIVQLRGMAVTIVDDGCEAGISYHPLRPGSVLLAEDFSGRGHRGMIFPDEPVVSLQVDLVKDWR